VAPLACPLTNRWPIRTDEGLKEMEAKVIPSLL